MNRIAVVGSGGAIGEAMLFLLAKTYPNAIIYSISRDQKTYSQKNITHFSVDYFDEGQLQGVAEKIMVQGRLDLVLVSNGVLHNDIIYPEKSLKDISAQALDYSFRINSILPALFIKHFLPILNPKSRSIFAAISARVGSISDNRLGGWYSYRSSKAALNMILKTASIEARRFNKYAIVIGLHPGTVASQLSEPFRQNMAPEKVMSPDQSAAYLLSVLQSVSIEDSGKCFAWDGKEVLP